MNGPGLYTRDMAIPAGFVRVTVPFTGGAVPTGAVNVLCFENTGLLDADAIQILFNSLGTDHAWIGMSDQLNNSEIIIKFGPDATGGQETRATDLGGSSSGVIGAAAPAVLVKKSTAAGGRRNRGRMYIPGVTEAQILAGGVLDPTPQSAIQGFVDTMFADLEAGGLTACVEHTDGSTPTEITSFTVDGTVATQRRRQRR